MNSPAGPRHNLPAPGKIAPGLYRPFSPAQQQVDVRHIGWLAFATVILWIGAALFLTFGLGDPATAPFAVFFVCAAPAVTVRLALAVRNLWRASR